ncbi:MAG: transglutaminase domain-containing protein, partial [Candidatus Accumulibacter sp.]|nr:transglutaminase domain-containing protein [Accumulibacter sp.]
MKRREFVTASAILALLSGSSARAAPAAQNTRRTTPAKPAGKKAAPAERPPAIILPDEPPPQWTDYELRTTIALKNADGGARLWLPLAQYRDTAWERSFGHRWEGNYRMASIYREPVVDMEVFYAEWPEDVVEPKLEIVSRVATQNRQFDITRRGAAAERTEILRHCLRPTARVSIDGIMRQTALRAVGRIKDPLAQAKALYDWVVENTSYDPRTQGAGYTPIASLLEDGHLTGRSIEISLLFVGLCRAVGIPARPVFGLRVDRSRLFASLGVSGESNPPHCRAEFYSPAYGWVPVDPSDVRRAILTESLSRDDPRLTSLKKLLFGFWEMNWIGFNTAQDVFPQGSSGGPLPCLTGPIVETHAGR